MSKINSFLNPTIEYFERLGVCVAVFAGGAAMVKFAGKLSPYFPTGAVALGGFVIFMSMLLAVLTAGSFIADGMKGRKGTFVYLVGTILCTVVTMGFLGAGIQTVMQELTK